MRDIRVEARLKLKEGFDMSRLKLELANDLEKDYLLKNVYLEDDTKSAAKINQPTHWLRYELSGELTPNDIRTGLEKTRDRLGTFDIEGLNIDI